MTGLARSPSDTVKGVLVAGVGNVFLSDDGFGVEVARRLAGRALPEAVEVVDVGIQGMHLAYRLLDGYRALVLVDAVRHGQPPGTLTLLEHDLDGVSDDAAFDAPQFDAHGMEPGAVLAMLDRLARGVGIERPVHRVLVVGCEPSCLDEGIGLSPPVAAAVDRAAQAVVDLVADLLEGGEDDQVGAAGGAGRGDRGGRRPDRP